MLIVKFKSQIAPSVDPNGNPKTGIASIDDLIIKHNCIVIQKFIDNFSNMDMAVASEVGLDRVYLFHFKQSQDVLLAMFDLSQDPSIQLVSPNHYMELADTVPNDPEANRNCPTCNRRQETYLTSINAYNGWDITKGKRNIRIAVIDTGVDDQHSDLQGKVIQNRSFFLGTCYHFGIWAYSCITTGNDSKPPTVGIDNYHGTHVAGIIGASTDNSIGVSGINWESEIVAIKVLSVLGSNNRLTTTEDVIGAGIVEAVNINAKVINLSLGGGGYEYCQWGCLVRVFTHSTEFGSVQYADKKRVTVIAAAGNSGIKISQPTGSESFQGFYPASFNEVISVSALSQNGTSRASFSNYGKIDIAAPGSSIYSTKLNNTFDYDSGTSMAAPMVSAFAGLILAIDPNLHPKSVLEAMCTNATPVTINDNRGTNAEFVGCGRINLGATLNTVNSSLPLPKITTNCGGDGEAVCPAGRWFEQFSFQFTVKDGVAPFKWSYQGGLPANTSLNPDTGALCCGPTYWFGPGWTFDVKVTDSRGKSDIKKVYFQSGL
jgi:subtilisin family serine protease